MALVIYSDGSKNLATSQEQPEFFDDEGRPSQLFIHSVLESVDVEALFLEDPSMVIEIEGVDYSLLLVSENADVLRLPVNTHVTNIAKKLGLIDKNDVIRGTVIFVSVAELGDV